MKTIASLFLVLAFSFPAFAGGDGLLGTWKSNKQTTLVYLKAHTQLTAQELEKVGQTLGKMTMTFDKTTLILKTDRWNFTTSYKVLSKEGNVITFECRDPSSLKMTENKLELDGNGFWSPDDRIPGYKERFDKVGQTEASRASK